MPRRNVEMIRWRGRSLQSIIVLSAERSKKSLFSVKFKKKAEKCGDVPDGIIHPAFSAALFTSAAAARDALLRMASSPGTMRSFISTLPWTIVVLTALPWQE